VDYQAACEAIFEVLSKETDERHRRTLDEWIARERICVWVEVNKLRDKLGLLPTTLAEVERIERLAIGHSDYVHKYACAAAHLVFDGNAKTEPVRSSS
jgi:hypothetical protein